MRLFPHAISIFILPPSMDELRDRLIKRNQDDPQIIKARLTDAQETISHIHEFAYVIINDDFAHALQDLKTIIEAGRLLQQHQTARFAKLIESFKAIHLG